MPTVSVHASTLSSVANAGGSASSLAGSATTDIANGESFFQSAVDKAKTGDLSGVMGAAGMLATNFPIPAVANAISSAVSLGTSIAAAAGTGAAVGGPYGAAAGVAIAVITDVFNNLASSPAKVAEDDYRSSSEQYAFPAIPNNQSVGEVGSFLLKQTPLYPFCWPDVRPHTIAFVPGGPGVQPSSDSLPGLFSFGVGWLPAPGTLPDGSSAAAAYWLTQSWFSTWSMHSDGFTPSANITDDMRSFATHASAEVLHVTDSDETTSIIRNALAMFGSWYGSSFSAFKPGFDLQVGNGKNSPDIQPDATGAFYTPGGNVSGGEWTHEWDYVVTGAGSRGGLNNTAICDFMYYFPLTSLLMEDQGLGGIFGLTDTSKGTWTADQVGVLGDGAGKAIADMEAYVGGLASTGSAQGAFSSTQIMNPAACPDTIAFGLMEIAYLWASGAYGKMTAAQCDLVALHFMVGAQWQWTAGQRTDLADNTSSLYALAAVLGKKAVATPHPNFSRILGIIRAKIHASKRPTLAKVAAPSTAKTAWTGGTLSMVKKTAWAGNGPAVPRPRAGVQKVTLGLGLALAAVGWLLKR